MRTFILTLVFCLGFVSVNSDYQIDDLDDEDTDGSENKNDNDVENNDDENEDDDEDDYDNDDGTNEDGNTNDATPNFLRYPPERTNMKKSPRFAVLKRQMPLFFDNSN